MIRRLALVLTLGLVVGCAQMAPPPPRDGLAGTSWQLVRFQGGDGTVLTPDDKAKYTVAFAADGSVTLRVDCNRGRGTWTSPGPNQLQLGLLALTRAMCPPGSLHDHIVKQWTFVRSYVMKGGHLFLSLMADGGTYEFEPMRAGVAATRIDVPTRSASPTSLPGELTMPRGAGPFPAVIILHGCLGVRPPIARERLREYASWYADRGYAGLIVDSFASRSASETCLGGEPSPLTRAGDAYRALEYLVGLGSIDPRRVVLQGHSHGGATVLTALDEITAEMAGTPLRFAGGIAYYPQCAYPSNSYAWEFYAPVLILIGEKDDWTLAADCERLRARASGQVRLTVFPGTTHSFDINLPPRRNEYGKYLAHDPDATRDAARRVEGFLRDVVR